jgi:hypothetical protein
MIQMQLQFNQGTLLDIDDRIHGVDGILPFASSLEVRVDSLGSQVFSSIEEARCALLTLKEVLVTSFVDIQLNTSELATVFDELVSGINEESFMAMPLFHQCTLLDFSSPYPFHEQTALQEEGRDAL